jgi:hypothetical protein
LDSGESKVSISEESRSKSSNTFLDFFSAILIDVGNFREEKKRRELSQPYRMQENNRGCAVCATCCVLTGSHWWYCMAWELQRYISQPSKPNEPSGRSLNEFGTWMACEWQLELTALIAMR